MVVDVEYIMHGYGDQDSHFRSNDVLQAKHPDLSGGYFSGTEGVTGVPSGVITVFEESSKNITPTPETPRSE